MAGLEVSAPAPITDDDAQARAHLAAKLGAPRTSEDGSATVSFTLAELFFLTKVLHAAKPFVVGPEKRARIKLRGRLHAALNGLIVPRQPKA